MFFLLSSDWFMASRFLCLVLWIGFSLFLENIIKRLERCKYISFCALFMHDWCGPIALIEKKMLECIKMWICCSNERYSASQYDPRVVELFKQKCFSVRATDEAVNLRSMRCPNTQESKLTSMPASGGPLSTLVIN